MISSPVSLMQEESDNIILRTDQSLTDNLPDDCDEKLTSYFFLSGLSSIQDKTYLKKRLGVISLNFLSNQLSYGLSVEGCYGWISNGVVHYDHDFFTSSSDPLAEMVDDLNKIAVAFPYLDFRITLFGDSCKEDNIPLLGSFIIKDGQVKLTKKSVKKLHGRDRVRKSTTVGEIKATITETIPCALDEEVLARLAKIVKDTLDILRIDSALNTENMTEEELDYYNRIIRPNCIIFADTTVKKRGKG